MNRLLPCYPGGDLSPRTDPQLLEDLADVGVDRALGEHQLSGYLAGGQSPGNQDRDLPLAATDGRRWLTDR